MKFIILSLGVLSYFVQEFSDSIAQPTGWKDLSNNAVNDIYTCSESKITPYFGKLDSSIKKTYTGLPPHYSITLSVSLLYTGYWASLHNYARIYVDGSQQFEQADISSYEFNLEFSYCQANVLVLLPMNQKEVTALIQQTHTSSTLEIQIKASFACTLLSLLLQCERLAIKNLYIHIQECHHTCLTCTGPLINNCVTCPNGSPISGTCTCTPQLIHQHSCVLTCPPGYYNLNGSCVSDCSINCNQCTNNICVICNSSYKLYNGDCVTKCPLDTTEQSNICVSLIDQLTNGGQQLGKYFYDISENVISSLEHFIYTPGTSNSKLNGQLYSYYKDIVMLGGFGSWADGKFTLTYTALQAHKTIRINLKAYFIDNWDGETFTIKVDGFQVYTKQVTSSSNPQNLFFRNGKDLIQDVTLVLDHLANTVTIELISTLAQSSYSASLGISDIYIYTEFCDVQCAQCSSTVCLQCQPPYSLIANKCILCSGAYNRQSDCSCAFGYYEINQISCATCPINCLGCTNQNNCFNCNSVAHYTGLPSCSGCEQNYFKNGINCDPCIDHCRICDTSSTCFECYEGYFLDDNYQCPKCPEHCVSCDKNKCLICETQYGLNAQGQCVGCEKGQVLVNGICKSCLYKCDSCNETLVTCLSCTQLRSSPPACDCINGYYELNQSCQQCSMQCSTCEYSSTNCRSCAGNRITAPTCDCPHNGVSFLQKGFVHCTTCDSLVVFAKFSDDLLSIVVDTGLTLLNLGESCDLILQKSTISALGDQPICLIDAGILTIRLGSQSTILKYQQLDFRIDNSLYFDGCAVPISTIQNNIVFGPDNLLPPIITFNATQLNYKNKTETIAIISESLDGKRGLNLIGWQISRNPNNIDVTKLINHLNTQLNKQRFELLLYNIESEKQGSVIINLLYQNFLQTSASSDLEIYFQSKKLSINPNITLPENPLRSHHVYQIPMYPVLIEDNSLIRENSEQLNMTITLKNSTYSKQLLYESIKTNELYYFAFNASNYNSLEFQELVIFFSYVSEDQTEQIQYTERLNMLILEDAPLLSILGGNRQIGYAQPCLIEAVLYNFSYTNYEIQWKCTNVTNGEYCYRQNSLILLKQYQQLATDEGNHLKITLTIPSKMFNPYEVLEFKVSLSGSTKQAIQASVIIMTIEDYVPQIQLNMDIEQKIKNLNYYDAVYLNYSYSEVEADPDLLLYVGSFYYNYSLIHLQRFRYLQIGFSLWDFLAESYESMDFKFTIYNAYYLRPSYYTINLTINVPPLNCQIRNSFFNQSILSLVDEVVIEVENCTDDNQPLEYQFVLYQNISNLYDDYRIGKLFKGIGLKQFSYQNQFKNVLVGTESSVLLVMVRDSLYGISNYTLQLNISSSDVSLSKQMEMLNSNIDKDQLIFNSKLILIQQMQNKIEQDVIEQLYDTLTQLRLQNLSNTDEQQDQIIKLLTQVQSISNMQIPSCNIYDLFQYIISKLDSIENSLVDPSLTYYENQFKNKVQIEKTLQYALQIDQLIQVNLRQSDFLNNNNNNNNNRLLQEQINFEQNNNNLSTQAVDEISNILNKQVTINGYAYQLNYTQYTLDSLKLSPQQLFNKYGNITNFTDPYSISQQYYNTNPYYLDTQFKNQDNLYPLYDTKLTNTQNGSMLNNLQTAISYTFEKSSDTKISLLQCGAKINDIWSIDVCQSKQYQNIIQCECDQLSPITILQAAQQIADSFLDIFTYDALIRVWNHNYITEMFTYILIVETVFYFWFLFKGKKLDNLRNYNGNDVTKIFPEKKEEKLQLHQHRISDDRRTDVKLPTFNQLPQVTINNNNNQDSNYAPSHSNIISEKVVNAPQSSHATIMKRPSIYYARHHPALQKLPSIEDEIISHENQNQFAPTPRSIIRISKERLQPSDSPNSMDRSNMKGSTKFFKHEQGLSGIILQIEHLEVKYFEGFKLYLFNHHKILGIYNRYDPGLSRVTRSTLMYISLLGSMAVLTFFGKIMNLNTVIALSILQTIFGIVSKKMLSFTIQSKNQIVNHFGFNLAICGFLLFYYVILVGIAKYDSTTTSIMWGLAYISNLFLDLVIYSVFIQFCGYVLILKCKNNQILSKIFQISITEPERCFFYGKSVEVSQGTDTKMEI